MKRMLSMSTALTAAFTAGFMTLSATADAQTLRWTSQGDALTLDPHSQNEGPTIAMNGSIYERLVNRDPDLTLVPELAVSWVAVEPTKWEFKLREGVKFHGGQDFTAADQWREPDPAKPADLALYG